MTFAEMIAREERNAAKHDAGGLALTAEKERAGVSIIRNVMKSRRKSPSSVVSIRDNNAIIAAGWPVK